jgi:ribosomal protein S18 acetylase RimI-like enzyme
VKPNEWRKRHQLAEDSLSSEAKSIAPVREEHYRSSFGQRVRASLGDLLRRQTVRRWAAQSNDRFVGLVTLRTGGVSSSHHLAMMVHPDCRGVVEETLLREALSTLSAYPSRSLSASIHPSYEQAIDTFRRYEFVEKETLDLLTIRL